MHVLGERSAVVVFFRGSLARAMRLVEVLDLTVGSDTMLSDYCWLRQTLVVRRRTQHFELRVIHELLLHRHSDAIGGACVVGKGVGWLNVAHARVA